jgi:hypothetical protein
VGIYFDYNDPIITNTVRNTFTEEVPADCLTTGITDPDVRRVLLYPNPCSSACWIEAPDGRVVDRVVVFDAGGRQAAAFSPHTHGPIRMPVLPPGLYGAQVWCGGSATVVRFVVE